PSLRSRAVEYPPDQLVAGRVDEQDPADGAAALPEERLQSLGLRDRARKAVEHHARVVRQRVDELAHHVDGHIVRHVLAAVLVPPNRRVCTPVRSPTSVGITATMPRNSAPAIVMRVTTRPRNSAVGRPGRMPGMKPPYRLMLSATSFGTNVNAV